MLPVRYRSTAGKAIRWPLGGLPADDGIFATTSGLRGNRLYVGMLGINH